MNPHLALFDFDRTLVVRDSFRLFGDLLAEGMGQRAHLFALAAAYKVGLLSNGRYKARVLQAVWGSKSEAAQDVCISRLHDTLRRCEYVPAVRTMRSHLESGDTVAILSASPLFYLRPFVHERWSSDIAVYGSEVRDDTGDLAVYALYGEKKRNLARQLIKQHAPAAVWAYTDHVSDLPLLELADHPRLVNPSRALRHAVENRSLAYEVL